MRTGPDIIIFQIYSFSAKNNIWLNVCCSHHLTIKYQQVIIDKGDHDKYYDMDGGGHDDVGQPQRLIWWLIFLQTNLRRPSYLASSQWFYWPIMMNVCFVTRSVITIYTRGHAYNWARLYMYRSDIIDSEYENNLIYVCEICVSVILPTFFIKYYHITVMYKRSMETWNAPFQVWATNITPQHRFDGIQMTKSLLYRVS